jgi:hypothetical protein
VKIESNSSRIFIRGRCAFANGPSYQPLFAFLEFRLKQRFEKAQMSSALSHRLLGKLGALCADVR